MLNKTGWKGLGGASKKETTRYAHPAQHSLLQMLRTACLLLLLLLGC
jgi:hypothetical protein